MSREQETLSHNINRISQGTEIIGTINTTGDIRIDGVLEGNLSSKGRVVIGETGRVKGELNCRFIDVWGTFEGTMSVAETTNMKAMASVTGDLKTNKLCIEIGSKFNGTCSMSDAPLESNHSK